ncbi:cell division protein SepF [Aciditerrimonas ferrireducens]|jgi:cell division inhibitor SepF|uniref:Cell division protein SepF n=1 Tax=Aciditerrimonas ferrireducens TaxID=667306 RepID=A0ABV6C3J8_9ACTN|nr:cell division protein SepF [Aciditerrimonas ferrireducens]MCK4178199.1 cell division protein SepF [Aciditerrimonas ferrireducens]
MPGFFKRTMAYLGLAEDDEYDDEDYEDLEPPRVAPVQGPRTEPVVASGSRGSGGGTIRPLVRDEPPAARPAVVRPLSAEPPTTRVHVSAPTEFGDARQIADRLVAGQPVIVNLQVADRELMRRMIDFCSGVTYAIGGKMDRVADRVFLVTPANVKVSGEERERQQAAEASAVGS